MPLTSCVAALAVLAAAAAVPEGAPGRSVDASAARVRKLLAELVAANTENPPGNEARAAAIGAERLRAAGIPHAVYEFAPGRANLVARLKGDGSAAPLLLLAHTDVVPTQAQPWTTAPHQLTERDGWLFGRGVTDDLREAAAGLEVLLRLKEQRVPLRRDVIVAWTGDEERFGTGIRWQLEKHPETIEAAVVITEGADVEANADGVPTSARFVVGEKLPQAFTLRAVGKGGHSSRPPADAFENPVPRVSRAVERIARYRFPPRLLPGVRAQFAELPVPEDAVLAAALRAIAASREQLPAVALAALDGEPRLAALLRTTCAVTVLSAGTAVNVLPSEATARVHCRILPDESPADVQRRLEEVIGDPEVKVVSEPSFGAAASPVDGEGPNAIRAVIGRLHPGIPVVPSLAPYATDGRFLRARGVPVYGFTPFPSPEGTGPEHGPDERMLASTLAPGLRILYELVLELAARRDLGADAR